MCDLAQAVHHFRLVQQPIDVPHDLPHPALLVQQHDRVHENQSFELRLHLFVVIASVVVRVGQILHHIVVIEIAEADELRRLREFADVADHRPNHGQVVGQAVLLDDDVEELRVELEDGVQQITVEPDVVA